MFDRSAAWLSVLFRILVSFRLNIALFSCSFVPHKINKPRGLLCAVNVFLIHSLDEIIRSKRLNKHVIFHAFLKANRLRQTYVYIPSAVGVQINGCHIAQTLLFYYRFKITFSGGIYFKIWWR